MVFNCSKWHHYGNPINLIKCNKFQIATLPSIARVCFSRTRMYWSQWLRIWSCRKTYHIYWLTLSTRTSWIQIWENAGRCISGIKRMRKWKLYQWTFLKYCFLMPAPNKVCCSGSDRYLSHWSCAPSPISAIWEVSREGTLFCRAPSINTFLFLFTHSYSGRLKWQILHSFSNVWLARIRPPSMRLSLSYRIPN